MTDLSSGTTAVDIVDDELAAILGPAVAATWRMNRGPQQPTIHVERADGILAAAILTTRRPATLALKIAATWTSDAPGSDAALERIVESLVTDAETRHDIAIKWQSENGDALPTRLGFSRMRTPYVSAAGTEGITGYVRWLSPVTHDEPHYYSQTSSFTCGAVTALLAKEIRGSGGFSGGENLRNQELDFWRQASNYPACEPIGLAVTLRDSLPDAAGSSPVEVFLDSDGPVLLEAYPEAFDRSFRAELQADSLRRAEQSDISVRRDRLAIEELHDRLHAGETALLLINTEAMYGFGTPHWVLAHAANDGVVFIDDPWISTSWGETWVDSHELPIAVADLDRMVSYGEGDYRGVVFLRRP